jgi:hypothetical protein
MGLRVWFGCALQRDCIDGGKGEYTVVRFVATDEFLSGKRVTWRVNWNWNKNDGN